MDILAYIYESYTIIDSKFYGDGGGVRLRRPYMVPLREGALCPNTLNTNDALCPNNLLINIAIHPNNLNISIQYRFLTLATVFKNVTIFLGFYAILKAVFSICYLCNFSHKHFSHTTFVFPRSLSITTPIITIGDICEWKR